MDLFHVQEEAPGSVFWHPDGWKLWRAVEDYIRRRLDRSGYSEVRSPQLVDKILWERSGHAAMFGSDMFFVEADKRTYALKPMNCPCHVQIFNQHLHSYRDLPLRMAEFGSCHRNEPSGALHGIMRVRAFTQDDAHIFCTPDQITAESVAFCDLLMSVYRDFGFTDVRVKFSDRPAVRAGADEVWDQAEAALWAAVKAAGLDCTLNPGEGAFYGPKLEFVLRDAIGRDWQCGTLQVDFVMPERLDANYVGPGRRQAPAGDAASGDPGLARALHRRADRALCRAAAAVAGAGAGGGGDDHQRGRRLRAAGRPSACGRRACGPRSTRAPTRSATRSASTACARCRCCWRSAAASRPSGA